MKLTNILLLCLTAFISSSYNSKQQGKHLFILSGQSNMAGLPLEESFTPTINAEFGKENVLIVKNALGGAPIRRWYKDWKPLYGNEPKSQPDLYDTLLMMINDAILNEKISTVTFIWMQGERDAREELGEVYEKSLIGLYDQLSTDLNRKDMNFIIGRLSDFDMLNQRYPHWTMIRDIQVRVGESNPRFRWINTDDLNDGYDSDGNRIKDDLHMSVKGYVELGKRFANESIQVVKRDTK